LTFITGRRYVMKKHLLIISLVAAFSMLASLALAEPITRANWTKMVGFSPDLEGAPFKPGDQINAGNADNAAKNLPPAIVTLMKKYGMQANITKYKAVVPSDGYIAATNANHGKAKITDTGAEARKPGISGYKAGLPVLKPKNGLEVAWNYHYGYNGDDGKNHFGVYWISAKSGVERWEEWLWNYIMRASNRTDIAPKPGIPDMANRGISYASLTVTLAPLDKKGFSALYYRYNDPKDQEGWIYLPQQRRMTRFTFGTRGDAWNNTDMLYEDVRGYMGYPEWMHWKILEKTTMYAPVHAGVPLGKDKINQTWDFETAPHWNPTLNWEARPMYVVEAKPKFRDYPYSKMVFYIDAESFAIIFKECYDKKGQIWKIIMNVTNDAKNPRNQPLQISGSLTVDLQAEHATAFAWYSNKMNAGLKSNEFNPTVLRKMGK
jgi:Protein of unknown function (DUF1329)